MMNINGLFYDCMEYITKQVYNNQRQNIEIVKQLYYFIKPSLNSYSQSLK